VENELAKATGTGMDSTGGPKPYTASGTDKIYAGAQAAAFFGATAGDPRVPDVYATAAPGVLYASQPEIAAAGGVSTEDRNVPLLIAGSGLSKRTESNQVSTTQIGPTILSRLGLDPAKLDAVAPAHTAVLPGA
jgi:hypothetical protein